MSKLVTHEEASTKFMTFVLLPIMNYIFIVLNIALCTISASKVRKTYQDQTSWSFQHPSVRYTKVIVDKSLVQPLTSIPINATSTVRKDGYYIDNKRFDLFTRNIPNTK